MDVPRHDCMRDNYSRDVVIEEATSDLHNGTEDNLQA